VRPTATRRLKWRLETLAYASVETGLGLLPVAWVAGLGRLAGAVARTVLPGRRRIVARNLRIAFAGEKSPAELAALEAEVFRRSGANLLCSMRTAEMGERSLRRVVTVRDEAVFRDAITRGKGVIAVLAHMGNWEALAQCFPTFMPPGVAGATVYRPLNNPIMNARVVATRTRRGMGLFSKDDNPLGMAAFLRRGGVLGVLADQRAGKIGELVPFFGRTTSCTPIPAILARRTGAAIVGLSLRTLGPGRWELAFHGFDEPEPSTAGVMRLLERMVRESPADVFWLQDRWKPDRRSPHRPAGKPPRGEAPTPTKRRRALLRPDEAGRPPVAPTAQPDDVDYETATRAANESAEAFLRRVDEAGPLPLDYVVGGAHEGGLAKACRRLGLGWIAGEKQP
jgi:KDO2-lipid IV(A) lauroyltransferase